MNAKEIRSRSNRSGAAFLMLVVLVLLVVVGATQTLVRSELTTRRSEADRLRVRTMETAINAIRPIRGDWNDPIRLPLDGSRGEFIEVRVNKEESRITARWILRDHVIDEMSQELENKVESNE